MDQPPALGQVDEAVGADLAERRVRPARERLDAADDALGHVHLGLVVHADRAGGDGLGEVVLGNGRQRHVAVHHARLGPVAIPALEGGHQRFALQRLADARHHGDAEVARHGLHRVDQHHLAAGHHDQRDRQLARVQLLDQLDAVHPGHLEVDEHHVRRQHQQRQQLERLGAAAGLVDHIDAQLTAKGHHLQALDDVVVDHQQRGNGRGRGWRNHVPQFAPRLQKLQSRAA